MEEKKNYNSEEFNNNSEINNFSEEEQSGIFGYNNNDESEDMFL